MLDASLPVTESIVLPVNSNETICDCGIDGSEKNVSRGSCNVPRTLRPTSAVSMRRRASMSMPGSSSGELSNSRRPRLIPSFWPSAS
jgi:hypothetical protein